MTDPLEAALAFVIALQRYEIPEPAPTVVVEQGLDWEALRECESNDRYRINTGNGYYGAYQFSLETWRGVGGTGYPHEASPAEQDARAQRLYNLQGSDPWPVCGDLL